MASFLPSLIKLLPFCHRYSSVLRLEHKRSAALSRGPPMLSCTRVETALRLRARDHVIHERRVNLFSSCVTDLASALWPYSIRKTAKDTWLDDDLSHYKADRPVDLEKRYSVEMATEILGTVCHFPPSCSCVCACLLACLFACLSLSTPQQESLGISCATVAGCLGRRIVQTPSITHWRKGKATSRPPSLDYQHHARPPWPGSGEETPETRRGARKERRTRNKKRLNTKIDPNFPLLSSTKREPSMRPGLGSLVSYGANGSDHNATFELDDDLRAARVLFLLVV